MLGFVKLGHSVDQFNIFKGFSVLKSGCTEESEKQTAGPLHKVSGALRVLCMYILVATEKGRLSYT